MDFQQTDHDTRTFRERLTSDHLGYYILVCLAVLAVLVYLLFDIISVNINCTRSNDGLLACSVVQESVFLKMYPVRIPEPVAVDIIEHHTHNAGKSGPIPIQYKTEMRSARYTSAVPIYSTTNFKVARNISTDVNHFLLHSQETSFSKRYP